MLFDEYIGPAGLLLLLLAWIPETMQNWKEKGRNLNLRFVALYFLGSLALASHAYVLQDMVFVLLNGLATLIALFNGAIILTHPKRPAKKAKSKKK